MSNVTERRSWWSRTHQYVPESCCTADGITSRNTVSLIQRYPIRPSPNGPKVTLSATILCFMWDGYANGRNFRNHQMFGRHCSSLEQSMKTVVPMATTIGPGGWMINFPETNALTVTNALTHHDELGVNHTLQNNWPHWRCLKSRFSPFLQSLGDSDDHGKWQVACGFPLRFSGKHGSISTLHVFLDINHINFSIQHAAEFLVGTWAT